MQTIDWIPVSEKLPEIDVEVLVTTVWDEITIAERFVYNKWTIHEGDVAVNTDDIKAWMPLPELYQAKPLEEEKKLKRLEETINRLREMLNTVQPYSYNSDTIYNAISFLESYKDDAEMEEENDNRRN